MQIRIMLIVFICQILFLIYVDKTGYMCSIFRIRIPIPYQKERSVIKKRNEDDIEVLNSIPSWEWPEDADSIILEVLTDSSADESDRVLAAGLAGDYVVINDNLADALVTILENDQETDTLRSTAAISLGPALQDTDIHGFDECTEPDEITISENMFSRIRKTFKTLYENTDIHKEVRRRILEASVRAPEDWHKEAVKTAYSSGDEDWKLTAVFAMRWIRGFDDQILESLENSNPEIHHQAVCAAGDQELSDAWTHVSDLILSETTEKDLLLAAIDAIAGINPHDAGMVLVGPAESEDEDIAVAAMEAMRMAEGISENVLMDEPDEDEQYEDG